MQQHCWVRAVQLEHNPSAWANLGMLYVRWGLDVQVGWRGEVEGRGGGERESKALHGGGSGLLWHSVLMTERGFRCTRAA